MNILLIAPQPFLEKRGTPLAIFQLIKALSQLGHNVDLITYHIGDDVHIDNLRHHRIWKFPFVTSVKKGQSIEKIFLDIFVFLKAFVLLSRNKYDCIHAVEEAATMGVFLKKLFNKFLIYDMDSSMSDQLRDSTSLFWNNRVLLWLVEYLEKMTIKKSDLVLAVCKALMEKVHSVSPGKKVVLLEDIPNAEPFDPSMKNKAEQLRADLGLKRKKIVLYTGTFESYQGIDLLLASVGEVVKEFNSVKFVLVGGDAEQVRQTTKEANALGIKDNLLILGKRPLEEMPLFMEISDILVSPRNKGTNTPMKIYTYLQSGKPIVATRLLTHTQILTDDVAVLVNPDQKSFSEGIMRVLRNEEKGKILGQAGRKLVEEYYSYDSFRNKLEGAYSLVKT